MIVPLIRKEDLSSLLPAPADWPEYERRARVRAVLVDGPAHVETRIGFHTEERPFYLTVDEETGFPIPLGRELFERNWRLADPAADPPAPLVLETSPDGPH